MSGSGGTVYDPEPPVTACDLLNFPSILNSPNPIVVPQLGVGTVLQVVAQPRADGTLVVVAMHGPLVAGSITSDQLLRLIDCTSDGHHYVAEVTSIKGAKVDVYVRHV
ncbi:hypothetical protein WQE_03287 [Paraburkholderia hospita]|uniref:Uncharacterized protein n=1 Tax=Paraburkholderia hospita TaxID=169430 RepID=A0ABN0FV27_9BURK|nr:hypothetical protein WQE_03287 [Paraburkholderia hospita]